MKRIIIRLLISVHFLIIVITVCHLNEKIRSIGIVKLIDYYSALTYTNRNFGFFAPAVYGDLDVDFDLYADSTTLLRRIKFKTSNVEMRARFYTLTGHFAESNELTVMDLYSRSWGVYLLNKNPDINKVVITVNQNIIPTMAEYTGGKRTEKEFFYTTTISVPHEE